VMTVLRVIWGRRERGRDRARRGAIPSTLTS